MPGARGRSLRCPGPHVQDMRKQVRHLMQLDYQPLALLLCFAESMARSLLRVWQHTEMRHSVAAELRVALLSARSMAWR